MLTEAASARRDSCPAASAANASTISVHEIAYLVGKSSQVGVVEFEAVSRPAARPVVNALARPPMYPK